MNTDTFIQQYAIDRHNSHSLKWDALEERFGNAHLLPLWVADMDFKVADEITDAMAKRIGHAVYGYSLTSDRYYDAMSAWHAQHFGYTVDKEWVRHSPGVVQSLYWCLNAFTKKGDAVAIMPPVYYPFFNAISDTHRQLVEIPLINTGTTFEIDFDAFEKTMSSQKIAMYIHCSPHNPVGRVWREEEQTKIFEICERYNVIILSDEIHQDFVYEPYRHVAALTVENGRFANRLIVANSGSKTFNLAALSQSTMIIKDAKLRQTFDEYARTTINAEPSLFGMTALEAGYTYGEAWLSNIKEVIQRNYRVLQSRLQKSAPEIVVYPLEGTYLALLDVRQILNSRSVKQYIQDECGLAIDYGEWFGADYEGFIRINLATTPENIGLAIDQMIANK